jgi:peptidoglycan-N-acetylglucosamine deacetylase
MREAVEGVEWPGGADVCVALTFDLDADVGVGWRRLEERLTSLSEARFGATRGVPRILDFLERMDLRATFYVPGEVADMHTDLVKAIVAAGHAIGHHGHVHLYPDRATATEQRAEIEAGLEALDRCVRVRPLGYRCPGWELTPYTLGLLDEFRFRWDSSCMGDDRPYVERHGSASLLELPVHWSLDDWVYFIFTRDGGGTMLGPDALKSTWLLEFESALAERRMVTYTMHPEAMGRGYRMRILEQLVEEFRARGNVWFATHEQVTDLIDARAGAEGQPNGGR